MLVLAIADHRRPLVALQLPGLTPGAEEIVVRVEAAGICRSDVHYRAGTRAVPRLPLVPGHEVAGTVIDAGPEAVGVTPGDRVCLHYLVTCGVCVACRRGAEQFCDVGEMIGLDRQGGYAEAIVVPARNAHRVPDGVTTPAAAVMMCSSATALHALRRADLRPGESVAVFGAGGLGMSAVQLARILGAGTVYAVDTNPIKRHAAAGFGAEPVDGDDDPAGRLLDRGGVDVALELVGSEAVMASAVRALAPGGRAMAVGITHREFGLDPFRDLVRREAEIRGAADHLASEIDELLALAAEGRLDVDGLITRTVPLDVDAVNAALDDLEGFGDDVRTVIVP